MHIQFDSIRVTERWRWRWWGRNSTKSRQTVVRRTAASTGRHQWRRHHSVARRVLGRWRRRHRLRLSDTVWRHKSAASAVLRGLRIMSANVRTQLADESDDLLRHEIQFGVLFRSPSMRVERRWLHFRRNPSFRRLWNGRASVEIAQFRNDSRFWSERLRRIRWSLPRQIFAFTPWWFIARRRFGGTPWWTLDTRIDEGQFQCRDPLYGMRSNFGVAQQAAGQSISTVRSVRIDWVVRWTVPWSRNRCVYIMCYSASLIIARLSWRQRQLIAACYI